MGFHGSAVTLAKFPIAAQAAALLVLSVIIELLLAQLHLPAALLLGPMGAAIIFAALQTGIRIPMLLFTCGQAIVGCMIARTITGSIVRDMMADWAVFLGAVVAVIIVSNALGWMLARLRVLPASTAIWGSSPGGASAMVLMSEAFGADMRLVAFMQYLRVVLVAVVATLVARVFTGSTGTAGGAKLVSPASARTVPGNAGARRVRRGACTANGAFPPGRCWCRCFSAPC